MSQLELSGLRKSFGDTEVIGGVDLAVEEGEFVVFVGPSGCGKSTLLRLIAGLEQASDGRIVIGGRPVGDLPPVRRGIAMVFQSYALYPHMSVFENIAFPLRVERLPEAEIRSRVGAAADVLQLDTRLEEKPANLSGGQRQRVAIGRAIVRQPKIFLFDEPLSNLDAALRSDMRLELLRLHDALGTTMIYVTHDQVEAMTMADKIVVLDGGRIEQVGSPMTLYHRPANRFVASFIGSPKMNFLDGRCTAASADGVALELPVLGHVTLPRAGTPALVGRTLTLGVRPEHVELDGGAHRFRVTPGIVERLGSQSIAHAAGDDGTAFVALFEGDPAIPGGEPLELGLELALCHLFDADGSVIGRDDGIGPSASA